jgi:2-phosphosulfolactate phosphatase
MKLSLYPSIRYIEEARLSDQVVIVIDVLRATSVITTALSNGAKEVIVKVEVEEAMELKGEDILLGGERKAKKIKGFDLSNSPLEYSRERVFGKTIVLTTTNGTKTIHRVGSADRILIGSMINGKAVARAAVEADRDVAIACAGTQGEFSLDDFICAGKIIYDFLEIQNVELDDFAASAYMAYLKNRNSILDYVKMAGHYKYLISIGLEKDIKYCFTEDIVDIVPEVMGEKIKARVFRP